MALVSAESLPEMTVDTAALISAASEISTNARQLRDRAAAVAREWAGLPDVFTMQSAPKIFSAMAPVDTVADDYADALDKAAKALDLFAESVAAGPGDFLVSILGAQLARSRSHRI